MKKNTEKYPWYIIALACLVLVFILVWFCTELWNRKHPPRIRFVQSIRDISPDISPEELAQEGYLDLTDVQPEKNKTITEYFYRAASGEAVGLKTFIQTPEGIVVRGLWHDKGDPARPIIYLTVYSYHVPEQAEICEDRYFGMNYNETEGKDGIVEVWLHDILTTSSTPKDQPYLLYRYYKEN